MPKEQTLSSSVEGLGFPILAKGSYFRDLPVIKHLQPMERWPHVGLHHLRVIILFLVSEPDGLCCVVGTWPHVRVDAFFDQSLGGRICPEFQIALLLEDNNHLSIRNFCHFWFK